MPGQYDIQTNFPIASVAQLIAQRPEKEYQARAQQAQQLVQGIQLFGQGVQSLVDRRNATAQALAQAHVYSQTPEGQALMAPTQTQTPTPGYGVPLQPGTDGPAGPMTTTSTPSSINENTLATAFRGEQPGNFMTNLMGQANQKRMMDMQQSQFGQQQSLEVQRERNSQALAEKRLSGVLALINANKGMHSDTLGQSDIKSLRDERDKLVADQTNLNKQQSGITHPFGWFSGDSSNLMDKNKARVAEIDSKLQKSVTKHSSTEDLQNALLLLSQ